MRCHVEDEIENWCWLQHRKLLDEHYEKEKFLECDTLREYLKKGIMTHDEADTLYASCKYKDLNWDRTVTMYVIERDEQDTQ